MNNWEKVKLGEVCNVTSSKRIFYSDYCNEGIPFYRSKEIIEKSKGGNISSKLYISKTKYNEIKKNFDVPKENDILLTSVGTLGVCYIVEKERFYFKDGNLTWIKDYSSKIFYKFLFYWLISDYGQNEIINNSIGSTQKAITIRAIKEFNILLPPLAEQKAIAGVLSAFDDKIELNNKIIKNLEEQAQTLYKHWFIDFEFPNENGQPYKSSGNAFKDSELGKIPTDWEVKKIKEVSQRLVQRVRDEKNIRVLSAISKGELELSERVFDKKVYSDNISNYIVVPEKSFAYNPARANIGSIGMNKFNFKGCVSPIYVVIQFENDYEWFWEFLIKSNFFKKEIIKRSSGTVRQNFDYESFNIIKVIYPNIKVISDFNKIYLKIYNNIKNLQQENEKLAEMRDYLLPKLMSGKIKVKME